MSNITTIPHLVLYYDKNIQESVQIPPDIKGDLIKEHDYLAPILMNKFPTEWKIICEEVDYGVETGTMFFNDEDGTVTLTGE